MPKPGRKAQSLKGTARAGVRRARGGPKTGRLAVAEAAYKEALEQQAATAEILKLISSRPEDIQPVLNAVVCRAARLCGARDASILRVEGAVMRRVAVYGGMLTAFELGDTRPITRGTPSGRAILEHRTVHVRDLRTAVATQYPEL